ncbi:hypothetical protein T07_14852 [Trichinella nelsoni]|uniref:Uncharacterized protein n=1 Tax=Trichinella nelsoni TaxID=6336 RepID=A0A0V0S9W1_9BILA|nr:hypothetical protein T07_14852 [Trichinella nelsoni]
MNNLYRPPSHGVFCGPGTQHSHLRNSNVPSVATTGFAMKPVQKMIFTKDCLSPSVIFAETFSILTNYGTIVASKFFTKAKWLSFVGKRADIWALVIYCCPDSGCQRWTGVGLLTLER